jgi:hypothetical protein
MENPHEIPNPHERNTLPENIGVVLFLNCYQKNLRTVDEINTKLSEHYKKTISLKREEICDILKKRAQAFAGHFDPGDILEL